MKFVLLLDHFDPRRGGLERYATDWTNWLARRGHEVHIVAGGGVSPTDKAIVLHRVEMGDASPLARAQRLADKAAALAPDVLHDLGAGLGGDIFQPLSGARVASRAGELRSLDVARRWRRRLSIPWVRRQAALDVLERRRLQRPNTIVVACSQRVADDLIRLADASLARIRLVYNAVDCQSFIPTPPAERAALRKIQGWPATGTLFLQVAHNFRLKGVVPALNAMALLWAQGCEAYLAVAGAGPNLDPYRAQAARLGIAERVRFLGPVDDPRPHFAAADALLHPTFYDACSLACLEAWASGLPVVVSGEDGASSLLTEGVQGWMIHDPGDAGEIAFRMKELLDLGRREAMGAQARVLAEHNDAADAFQRLEALCREAAGIN